MSSDSQQQSDRDVMPPRGIPAVVIDCSGPPTIQSINSAYRDEFDITRELTGVAVSAVDVSGVPTCNFHQQTKQQTVDVDLITQKSTIYLRVLQRDGDRVVANYINATNDIPYQQHIDVLHRIFRHNLKNGINSIMGWARIAENKVGSDTNGVEQAIEQIVTRGEELARLSREAGRLNEILNAETHTHSVNLSQVVSNVASEYQSERVVCDIPANTTVQANKKLNYVIDNLIDNAFRHTESSVLVEATQTDSEVELVVADNGPGLPEIEQQIVAGESETDQLNHTDGLGLWLVNWVLDEYNADVSVATDSGTEYTITLHR